MEFAAQENLQLIRSNKKFLRRPLVNWRGLDPVKILYWQRRDRLLFVFVGNCYLENVVY